LEQDLNTNGRTTRTTRKISKEVAEQQIESWLEYFGLDFNDIVIEDGKEAAETLMNTLVRAIMRGELEINVEDELRVTQHLKFPTENSEDITYLDKVAKARIAMGDSKNSNQRMYSFMAALAGVPHTDLMKLKGPDSTVFNRLATVFSMV
jgi:hypothetical protein